MGIACAFFSPVFFAFQTDTHIYSVFHPLDEFQPATTAFASERDRQPSATSGIAPIAIASNYKSPSTSSSFLYNFYCTSSSATLQNLFYYIFLYIFSTVLERVCGAPRRRSPTAVRHHIRSCKGALFMLARCVVFWVISDGWVLAGFEGFDEGRKKSFVFIDFRACLSFLVVCEFAATRPDAGEF